MLTPLLSPWTANTGLYQGAVSSDTGFYLGLMARDTLEIYATSFPSSLPSGCTGLVLILGFQFPTELNLLLPEPLPERHTEGF